MWKQTPPPVIQQLVEPTLGGTLSSYFWTTSSVSHIRVEEFRPTFYISLVHWGLQTFISERRSFIQTETWTRTEPLEHGFFSSLSSCCRFVAVPVSGPTSSDWHPYSWPHIAQTLQAIYSTVGVTCLLVSSVLRTSFQKSWGWFRCNFANYASFFFF